MVCQPCYVITGDEGGLPALILPAHFLLIFFFVNNSQHGGAGEFRAPLIGPEDYSGVGPSFKALEDDTVHCTAEGQDLFQRQIRCSPFEEGQPGG